MIPKPAHLAREYGEQFADHSVVSAYSRRPPYPEATVAHLRNLMSEKNGAVLDVGCGDGSLSLPLAAIASRVDAVDPSAAMLDAARARAGILAPNVRWIHATIEDADLTGPYALATAAHSLHWTEWDRSLPRLAALLAPGAKLALVQRRFAESPWQAELAEIIPRYSTNRKYQPYDLVEELERRGLFVLERRFEVPAQPFRQTVDDFIESFHSANGFSRDRMSPDAAQRFDEEVRCLVAAHGVDRELETEVGATIEFGVPRQLP